MARKKPLGKIKDVAVGSLKVSVTAAGSAVGLAKGAAAAGRTASGHVAKAAMGKAAGAVSSLVGGGKGPDPLTPVPAEQESRLTSVPTTPAGAEPVKDAPKAASMRQDAQAKPADKPAAEAKKSSTSRPEPVNVTRALDLDPAPVDKPKPAEKASASKPTTKIDAAADPSDVNVTPADVAEAVAKEVPSGKKSVE